MLTIYPFLSILLWLAATDAHLAAFHKGMYCLNGTENGNINLNSNSMVTPLYQLSRNDWWFHHTTGCDNFPPAPGDFLDLPAGGTFTVELATNRGKTSLSFGGKYMSDWPDGNTYPENYNVPTCITSPNMHTQNQSMAAGTAFAISYKSNIKDVTPENLAVFSVRHHTPWKRVTTYDVPAAMPPCPKGGCICAWGWVPHGCGQPNIYHQPFRCRVLNSTSNTPVAPAKAPVWCEGKPASCTSGAKQMIYWNQNSGNNIQVEGFDLAGDHKSPAYNNKCGFSDGAQNDIFAGSTENRKKRSEVAESISVSSSVLPPKSSSPNTNKRRLVNDGGDNTIFKTTDSGTVLVDGISSHKRNSRLFKISRLS